MAGLLFGIPVPEGAVNVEIRPILGRGGGLAMYFGPIGDGLSCDTEIVVAVSRNKAFWEYLDSKGLESQDGTWAWRLRIVFVAASGVASDPVLTPQPVEFYQAKSLRRAGGGGDSEDAVARITAAAMGAIRDVGAAAANILREANAPLTTAVNAVRDMQQAELDFRAEAMSTIGDLSQQLQLAQRQQHVPAGPAEEEFGPLKVLNFINQLKTTFGKPGKPN